MNSYSTEVSRALHFVDADTGQDILPPFPTGDLIKGSVSIDPEGYTLVYFGCEDCAVEGSRVAAAGGNVHREKMSIGEYGFIVLAVDTEGNMFGLHSLA